MQIIASMFDSRAHAEDGIGRLVSAQCPRDAISFLPEEEVSETASSGAYDWRSDRWGLWRGLALFETVNHPDRYSLAEGMNRGASVLLVAARDDEAAERYGSLLVEAGAIDLDERERSWREAGWMGFDGPSSSLHTTQRRPSRTPKVRLY